MCFLLFLSMYSIVFNDPVFILVLIDCFFIPRNNAASDWQMSPCSFSDVSIYHAANSVFTLCILIKVSFFLI